MKQLKRVEHADKQPTVRTSVSLPQALHAELERIARDKKVSLAWVVRDAAEKYVVDQWPLLAQAD